MPRRSPGAHAPAGNCACLGIAYCMRKQAGLLKLVSAHWARPACKHRAELVCTVPGCWQCWRLCSNSARRAPAQRPRISSRLPGRCKANSQNPRNQPGPRFCWASFRLVCQKVLHMTKPTPHHPCGGTQIRETHLSGSHDSLIPLSTSKRRPSLCLRGGAPDQLLKAPGSPQIASYALQM